jgi:hypothetical protein
MSTRQTIVYTLFIFFLAAMLFTIGWWLRTNMELDAKAKRYEALDDRLHALEFRLRGTTNNPMLGIVARVDDPVEGLERKLKDLNANRDTVKSSDDPGSPGMEQRKKKYEDLSDDLKKSWTDTGIPAWKTAYDTWNDLDSKICQSLEELRAQKTENESNIKKAEDELRDGLAHKDDESKKIIQEKAKMDDELNVVRFSHEETSQKVAEVSRDLSKVKAVVKQGTLVGADNVMRTCVIDLGARQGVRKGQMFTIYDGSRLNITPKGLLQVTEAGPFSSKCALLDVNREMRTDPQTGWVPTDPRMAYSPYSATGPEDQDIQELSKPKTKQDRVEAMRLDKILREQGQEAADNARTNSNVSTQPPSDLTPSLNPIQAGDWIFHPDFVAIVSDKEFHEQTRGELLAMRDVNIGPLTFFITKTVPVYRKEYLRRMAERNGCRVGDSMSTDVNVVVTGVGNTDLDALEQKLASSKGKDDVKEDILQQRAVLATLKEAQRIGATVLAEDQVEGFFDTRQRKQELLRGKLIQPGRRVFLLAGKTKDRTPEALGHYIEDHGGVVAKDIDDKVDYVVVGVDPEKEFIDMIKKRGLKIIREEEIPEFFGEKR